MIIVKPGMDSEFAYHNVSLLPRDFNCIAQNFLFFFKGANENQIAGIYLQGHPLVTFSSIWLQFQNS